MAIGDVKSDTENDLSGNSMVTLAPSAGDEWIVGVCLGDEDISAASPNEGVWFSSSRDGRTGATMEDYIAYARCHNLINADETMAFDNSNGNSRTVGFFAIEVDT